MKKISNYYGLMLISLFLTFSSCEQTFWQLDSSATKSQRSSNFLLETVYLGFEGNLHDAQILWQNIDVYSAAYDRIAKHLKFENNQLIWDVKSATELNISQNIYDYIIFMWDRCNKKLISGDYSLDTNGIYFQLIPKNPEPITISAQLLFKNQHKYNMEICTQVVRNAGMGYLGYYIDLNNSDFGPDSWGGYYIMGRGDDSLGRPWSYIVYNVCPMDPKCSLNYIVARDSYETGGTFYEKVMNERWSPLVTVTNAEYVRY